MRIDAAHPLILGSASPRRRELLALLGVPMVVMAAEIDESVRPGEAPSEYLERIARSKLDGVRARAHKSRPEEAPALGEEGGVDARRAAVLVADTVVVAPDGGILGKPRDDDDSRAMMDRLAGRTHQVCTRFLLAAGDRGTSPAHAQTVTTRVTFRAVGVEELRAYVATGEGRDKAGAYAVQGRASAFVERIEGSYTGVVGLPLCELSVALRTLGWF